MLLGDETELALWDLGGALEHVVLNASAKSRAQACVIFGSVTDLADLEAPAAPLS